MDLVKVRTCIWFRHESHLRSLCHDRGGGKEERSNCEGELHLEEGVEKGGQVEGRKVGGKGGGGREEDVVLPCGTLATARLPISLNLRARRGEQLGQIYFWFGRAKKYSSCCRTRAQAAA